MAINFYSEGINFKPKQIQKLKSWIKNVAAEEGFLVGNLNYVFCNDEYILEVNKKYLNHDYYTDIITFDYTSSKKIGGDLVVSIDTIKSNSILLNVDLNTEVCRVIIHGVLHLCGYKDKSDEEERNMRLKEDYYLTKFDYIII